MWDAAGRHTGAWKSPLFNMTIMKEEIDVPLEILKKWQEIVNLLAEIMNVPSALIMRAKPPNIEVFVASESAGNPYEVAETALLNTGLYCDTVMESRRPLRVADALHEEAWQSNPDIALGMISYMGVPIVWPDGRIFGTICVLDRKQNAYSEPFLRFLRLCRDVLQTDLQMLATLNRELESRDLKIRRLVDSNIIGIFIWEIETQTILEANDAFLHIVGYDREDLSARRLRWPELTPPEWREYDLRVRLPELKRVGHLHPFEKEYFRKDGSRVPVLMGVAKYEDEGNHAVAFMLDLSARKHAEAEARESDRRLRDIQEALTHANRVTTMGQLTASISHQLKQPIGACATHADAGLRWLQARQPDLDEARQAFQRIGNDARLAIKTMTHIRDLFRHARIENAPLQINDAIEEIVFLTHGEAIKQGVAVRTDLDADLPLIHGDRVQLQQVVLNLIVNAMEAMSTMPAGAREVNIRTRADDAGAIAVTVRDTGPGVAPETTGRLFDPFFTTKPNGMGMGLSICQSIVHAHGGTLRLCASDAGGSVFQFTVPAGTASDMNAC